VSKKKTSKANYRICR